MSLSMRVLLVLILIVQVTTRRIIVTKKNSFREESKELKLKPTVGITTKIICHLERFGAILVLHIQSPQFWVILGN